MLSRRASLVALALVTLPATATAQQWQPSFWGSPRIDPWIDALFAHRARFGTTLPAFRANHPFERDGAMPVVVRFDGPVTQRDFARLASQGVQWLRGGQPIASGAWLARATEAGVRALAAERLVGRVQTDMVVDAPAPLDQSARETAIDAARRAILARDGTTLDGRGVVIGDVDSPLFIFHPALFNADGGVYRWVDADGDNAFTPGTDGVDLDGDGMLAPGEVLVRLAAVNYDRTYHQFGTRYTEFRPERDWLYLDTNGNHRRDYGAGFDESTPAYGEPLFVVDDANRDGQIAVSEHLLRLGTSKVRAVLSDQEYYRGGSDNGAPLIQYDLAMVTGPNADATHATGVAGVLVGGVPGVSQYLGLAPGADLQVADNRNMDRTLGTAGALQWQMDHGANILLTEYAPYAGVSLDGGSEEEMLLDSAVGNGVLAVSPAGNLAEGHKHRTLSLSSAPLTVTAGTDSLFNGATFVQFSLHWRAPTRNISVAITLPGGAAFMVPDNAPRGFDMGMGVLGYSLDAVSMRGTRTRHIAIYSRTTPLPGGEYTFALTPTAGAAIGVEAFIADDRSTWGNGITFPQNDATRTICHPSTSDQTIAVAAYTLHGEQPYFPSSAVGDLAAYSSHGPRLDGDPGIDIAAPDNPLSLYPPDPAHSIPYGALVPFGGTSGAGPHVAAAAALLRQLYPMDTGAALRSRLLDHARTDSFVHTDQPALWGRGKLDMTAALELTDPMGQAPTLVLRTPPRVMVGRDAIVTPEVTDDEPREAQRVRWDTDYDGTYDTDWLPLADQVIRALPLGVRDVRAEVRDGQGHVAGATVRIEAVANLPDPPDAGDGGMSGGGGGGCHCAVPAGAPRGLPRGATLLTAGMALVLIRRRGRRGPGDGRG